MDDGQLRADRLLHPLHAIRLCAHQPASSGHGLLQQRAQCDTAYPSLCSQWRCDEVSLQSAFAQYEIRVAQLAHGLVWRLSELFFVVVCGQDFGHNLCDCWVDLQGACDNPRLRHFLHPRHQEGTGLHLDGHLRRAIVRVLQTAFDLHGS